MMMMMMMMVISTRLIVFSCYSIASYYCFISISISINDDDDDDDDGLPSTLSLIIINTTTKRVYKQLTCTSSLATNMNYYYYSLTTDYSNFSIFQNFIISSVIRMKYWSRSNKAMPRSSLAMQTMTIPGTSESSLGQNMQKTRREIL